MAEPTSSRRTTKLVAKVTDVARDALAPEETVIIAVRVVRKGTVGSVAAGAVGGVAGVLVSSKLADAGTPELEAAELPTDPQQVFALTDRSLIILNTSAASGRVRQVRKVLPLTQLAAVTYATGRMGDRLTLTLRSGAEVSYVCVKVDPGERFARLATERLQTA